MDGQEYLEPGFDPSSLTVPRLRSILLAHSINYPSSAKKGQLIDIFNEHVASQASKIKSASLRVKRSSRGIVNVPSSQQTADVEDKEDDETAPLPSTATRSGRRSTRSRTEEPQEISPTLRSIRHSTAPPEHQPRRVSSKHARAQEQNESEQEPEVKRAMSVRSRPSATPVVRKAGTMDEDSPFSSENVFQTGSSPPPPSTATSRRTTQHTVREVDRRKSSELRRRTEEVKPPRQQMDGAVVPTRKTFEMPVSAMKKQAIEPSEEFTPEAQQELVQAQESGALVPARRRQRKAATGVASNAVATILLAFLAGFGWLWGDEKFNVGYCGVGQASREIAGVEVPPALDIVRPQCEPCPAHAICHDRFQTSCEPGFVLTHHPLSLNGLLPLPPTCEPDSVKARKVEQVKDRAVQELRQQNARYECGEAASPQYKEPELKRIVSSERRKGMNQEEFEDLWASAIGEVMNADEVTAGADGSGHFTLRSSSLAAVPLTCAIRRSLRATLKQYFWQFVGVLLVLSSGAYGRHRITSGRETEAQAKRLASLALEKLNVQAALHASDPDVYRENYIPMAQLRDDVLRDEFSATRRGKLWEKVQQKVERNSNVRPMVREGRSGDVGRVWEWVGAIGMLESPSQQQQQPGSEGRHRRRKSGRVSFGADRFIEPSAYESEDSREMSEVGRWHEGGSYY